MTSFPQVWNKVANTLKSSPKQPPSTVTIPRDHIDENKNSALDTSFKKDQHYFQVMINEMYLANEREWLNKIDPVVYAVSEFTYNGKAQVVPFLVGPGLLKDKGIPDKHAKGIIIKNESITGLRPYRGGGLTLSVVLCETKDNLLRPLLRVVESAAKALDFSPVLGPYIKVASVVMDGFEMLFDSGGITPIVGLRDSYGPNFNIPFRPSYFALIDEPSVNPQSLWVQNKQLMVGPDWDHLEPFRRHDFMLYSFALPENNERDDVDTMSFFDTWVKVRKEAASPIDDPNFKNARTQMSALYLTIVESPDLIEGQADALADQYAKRMKEIHEKAKSVGTLGGEEAASPEQERLNQARKKSLDILNW
jgi:hypothetical protein